MERQDRPRRLGRANTGRLRLCGPALVADADLFLSELFWRRPDTARLERFDPLYYEGSPSAWATGSKSSMVFINSNVQAHGLALRVKPTTQDSVTVRYAHIRVNELRSPIQFGQATRVDTTGGTANVITGVTSPHLSDDLFLEYNRIINRNTFLTAGVSVSFPGKGIRDTVAGDVPNWTGGFINVVVNF